MNDIVDNPKCPNCGAVLQKKPARKVKCPACSKPIFVRKGILLNATQVEEYDLVQRWLSYLVRLDVTEPMFIEQRDKLSHQFGFRASMRDALWNLMNALVMKQKESNKLIDLYLRMAEFVEEEGRDAKPYVKQAMEVRAREIRLEIRSHINHFYPHPARRVRVMTCNDEWVCDACRELSSRPHDIEDFLRELPIPMKCQNPHGCRCWINFDLG
jgi:hypothetical protein